MNFREYLAEAVKVLKKPEVTSGFHGSDKVFSEFKTHEVFLAKNLEEAKRYGKNIYVVEFQEYIFETGTIYVLKKEHVLSVKPR